MIFRSCSFYASFFYCRLRMGCVNVVVLNDFPSTKEAFSQDAFIGRPPEFPFATNKENIGNTYTVMILLLQNRKKLAEFAFKKLYVNTENVKRFFLQQIHTARQLNAFYFP